ncbi:hypothetical protein DPMN_114507 [Dreissena polymorpha]|uniref:Uncharacterized protein n=1 Tax=Dreissena polymorpha TaxID=45954 RepID=A0A9D4QS30_DREPO|nr:hypothetical protein DPMN_114507 [Dreissena polymorpha]
MTVYGEGYLTGFSTVSFYGEVYLTGMATMSFVRGSVPYGDGHSELCTGSCTLRGWPQ